MNFNWSFAFSTLIKVSTQGVAISLLLVLCTLVISMPIGFLLGIVRYKHIKVAEPIIMAISSFLRGTPLVVQIFIVYNGLPRILNIICKSYGIGIDFFSINAFAYAVVIFTFNYCMVFCEIFRSALSSVNNGQGEAAISVGLSSFQSYVYIIVPQALVCAVPNICNAVLNLFKGTSLVYFMAIQDITGTAKTCAARGYNYVEAYTVIFFVYIVLCFIMQRLFTYLENKLKVYKVAV